MDHLTGIHAVREALEAGRALDRIVIAKGRQDTRTEEIVQLARKLNVPVRFEDCGQLDRLVGRRIIRVWWRWRRRGRRLRWRILSRRFRRRDRKWLDCAA